jgi:hypothetical protein
LTNFDDLPLADLRSKKKQKVGIYQKIRIIPNNGIYQKTWIIPNGVYLTYIQGTARSSG